MTKKRIRSLIIAAPVILLGLMYGGGYIGQLLGNYADWQERGGGLGDGTAPLMPSGNFFTCIASAFRFPYGLYGMLAVILAIGLLIFMVMKMGYGDGGETDRDRNFEYSASGVYGTAGYMSEKEAQKVFSIGPVEKSEGIILGAYEDGRVVSIPSDTFLNSNVAVYGASGSMKSRAYSRCCILNAVRRGTSIVVLDPKSELYASTSEYCRKNGYVTRVLNLVDPEHSDGWDCLREVEGSELMAQTFTDVVIQNTGSGRGDPFWDNGELNLLKACILYVDHAPSGVSKTFPDVYRMITMNNETALNKMFDALPVTHPAKTPYNIFKQASETVRSGIIIGLGTRLQVMQNSMIQNILSQNEIDLTLPGKQKCAYYVIVSDQDQSFEFVSSLFFSFLFIKLVRFADKYGENGQLPVPVHIVGDEWCSCGKLSMSTKISTMRSRRLSVSMIFQNLPQLQNRYPENEWQEMLGNCDTTLFLGCTDPLTAEFISDRSGDISTNVHAKSKMLGTWRVSNYTPEYRETSSVGRRKLLTPDEVLRMPMDECLAIIRGQKVCKLKKFDYTQHNDAHKLVKSDIASYVPQWRQRYRTPPTQQPPAKDPFVLQPGQRQSKPAKPTQQAPEKPKPKGRRRNTKPAPNDPEQLDFFPVSKEDVLS